MNNALRVKLLFAAAVLTVTALQTRPAQAICRPTSVILNDEQECVAFCNSLPCPHYSWDGDLQICTCSFH